MSSSRFFAIHPANNILLWKINLHVSTQFLLHMWKRYFAHTHEQPHSLLFIMALSLAWGRLWGKQCQCWAGILTEDGTLQATLLLWNCCTLVRMKQPHLQYTSSADLRGVYSVQEEERCHVGWLVPKERAVRQTVSIVFLGHTGGWLPSSNHCLLCL